MRFAARFSFFLLPPLVQGGLTFLMLPATTFVLDAADFGAFALFNSLVGFAGTIATMGSGYLLSAHFPGLDPARRKGLVTACFLVGMAASLLFVAGFLALWPHLAQSQSLATIPRPAVYLALAAVALAFPWTLACDITVLEGKSQIYAVTTICQSVVMAATTLAGLYVFKLGLLSLFISGFAGGLVCFLAGMLVLYPYLGATGVRGWLGAIFKVGPVASFGNLAESLQTTSERYILSNHAGLTNLGIYSHSQQYRQLVFTVVKAMSRSVWPSTLRESRADNPDFSSTTKAWTLVHLGLAMAGVFFATVGKEAIALMTHGKFASAYPLAAAWMVVLLIKHSGRVELGYMTAHKYTGYLATLSLATVSLSIPCMFILIPRLGVAGAVISLLMQDLGYRVGLTLKARSLHKFEFNDMWVVKGALLIAATLAVTVYLSPDSLARLALLVVLEGYLAWVVYGKVRTLSIAAPAFAGKPIRLQGKEG